MKQRVLNESLRKLDKLFNSEKGKREIEEYFAKIKRDEDRYDGYVEKFKKLYENRLDFIIEKLMTKYYSDAYCLKERRLGYQSREKLLWLVYSYAKKYCKKCRDKRYWNMFTGEAYYVGSYVIQVMHGQGSVLRIDKRKNK